MLRISVKLGNRLVDEVYSDAENVTIGRDPGHAVAIENLGVSARHARVVRHGGGYRLEDLGSTNGTFVGGERVSRRDLRDGDEALVGKHTLVFHFGPGVRPPRGADAAAAGGAGNPLDGTLALETASQREILQRESVSQLRRTAGGTGVLTVLEGGTDRGEYEIRNPFTMIGKDPAAGIRLTGVLDPKVAGFVALDKQGYALVPGENGGKLRLNGSQVRAKTPLTPGDVVKVRGVSLRFELRP